MGYSLNGVAYLSSRVKSKNVIDRVSWADYCRVKSRTIGEGNDR